MNELKILYIGVFNEPHVSDNYRLKGFEDAGFQVRTIDFRQTIQVYGARAFEEQVKEIIGDFGPDLFFVNKGELLCPSFILGVKSFWQAPWLLFFGDKREELPGYIKRNVSAYDAVLLNSDDVDEKDHYRIIGAKNIFYYHTATDIDVFDKQDVSEDVDLVFFGGNYESRFPESKTREVFVRALLEDGYDVKVYGSGWNFYGSGTNHVYGHDFAREASRAKIILGFQNFATINRYTSNRTFNCMACGMYLTMPWRGCYGMFEDGKHLVYFSNYQELREKIDRYLDDPVKRWMIFEAGRKLIKKKHTYKQRAFELADIYRQLTGATKNV